MLLLVISYVNVVISNHPLEKNMTASTQKKSGGAKKIGRNGSMCRVYRDRNVRMRNKIRKVARHIKRFPADLQAKGWTAQL